MLARAKLTRQGGHRVKMTKNGQRNEPNLHCIDFRMIASIVSDKFLLRALAGPKSDDLSDKAKCENEQRNRNHHRLEAAGGASVTVNGRGWTEEATPSSNHISNGE